MYLSKKASEIFSAHINKLTDVYLQQVSRVIALLAGGVFCAVQALSYHGYMKVNYDRLKSDVEVRVFLDCNKLFRMHLYIIFYFASHALLHPLSPLTTYRLQSMMDLNGDGKVDEKDAEKALDQVDILYYILALLLQFHHMLNGLVIPT